MHRFNVATLQIAALHIYIYWFVYIQYIIFYYDSINIYRTMHCYLYNVRLQLIALSQVKAVIVHCVHIIYAFSDPMLCDVSARGARGPL